MRLPFALLLLSALPAAADTRPPLSDGEALTYKVSWAVVMGAGEIKIAAQRDASGAAPRLRVTTTTATRGLARLLLPFDARAESLFDLRTGRMVSLAESSQQRSRKSEHSVTFDYATSRALYSVPGGEDKPRSLELLAGDPLDLINSLVQTRSWNLKLGEMRDALVLFDDEFYQLTIHAVRAEEVETPLGTFKTLVLEPRMEKTPPKGMFKKGSTVRVWIEQDDERHLPVKFEVEFKIGTGVATLANYEPPSSAEAAEAKPASGKPAPESPAPAAPKLAGEKPAAPDAKDSRL